MVLEPQNITDALERLATAAPGTTAFYVPGRKSLTFGELNDQIRYVKEQLIEWDITPGNVVAGVIPSRPEMAAACAALPSSSTFAPLGSGLTTEQYSQLLVRMRASALLVLKGNDHVARTAARNIGITEIEIASDPEAPAGQFTMRLLRNDHSSRKISKIDPDVAYILTSSGTTGQPKLVPSTHRQTLLYAKAASEWLEYSSNDLSCHLMPIHSGNGLRGLVNPLLAGVSQLCLGEADVEALFKALERYPITCLNTGFALQRAILRALPTHMEAIRQSRFRFLRAGTGRLHPDEIDQLEQAFQAPALVSLSSVETPISHDPLPPRRRKSGAAGLAFVNEVATISDSGQVLPENSPGEIVVRGPLVFSEYVDDSELTAASFHKGWFRTGDLGHVDEDGYIHVSGRLKDIINRGGEKISPVEIDMALESLPQIREAAAFGVPHKTLGEELVAAAVREGQAAIDEPQLMELIRQRVGPSKTPRKIYFVDRLPRNANGKLLRHKMADMVQQDYIEEASSGTDPSNIALTPLQRAISEIWTSLLQVGNFRADDNFFLVGGDSLQAVQLTSHIKQLFRVELALESLSIEAWTISGIARAIESAQKADAGPHAHVILTKPVPRNLTFTEYSRRPFFFFHGDLSGTSSYWLKLAHHLGEHRPLYPLEAPGLDGQAFPGSIEEMACRHLETMRRIQQQGPYLLGGYCNGGLVAFETARQLQQSGEKVDVLILIEAAAMNRRKQRKLISCAARILKLDSEQELECYARLPAFLSSFRKLSYSQRIQFLFKKRSKFRTAVRLIAQSLTQRLSSPITKPAPACDDSDFGGRSPNHKLALLRRIMAAYTPQRYDGLVTIFRCKDGHNSTSEPTMGWRDVAAEVDLHEIPGDHVSCLTEHVGALAGEIKSCLERS